MAIVFVPTALRTVTGGRDRVEVPGETVRQVIESLEQRYPGFASGLCQNGRLRPGMAVTVDGSLATLGLLQPVAATAEIHFLPALGGG